MRAYVLRRAAAAILVLFAAYTLSFVLLSALPGDAVTNKIQSPEAQMSPESARALLEYYGLDRPVVEQYLHGLGALAHGDLGFSITNGRPVIDLIAEVLPSTAALAGAALVVGIVVAAVLALLGEYASSRWIRTAATAVPVLFASVPTFVVGIVILQVFAFKLFVIPAADDGTFTALIAPAVTLGVFVSAPLAQVFGRSIEATRKQAFVHVLYARGAAEPYVFTHGVLRNSSLPVLTLLGLAVGELIAGSVVTEAIFARPGIGQLTVSAVSTQDLPVLQGVVLVAAAAYVLVNLVVDLVYPVIDSRILIPTSAGVSAAWRVLARRPTGRRTSTSDLPVEAVMP
ncbi:ABC transporter permease [Gordonia humi]|uniref:Peptide/nickel transport system permease protein n=1 Tax=Gordonia humi TaxID=686429 RepID=A0A840EYL1_9ACTN|nr:ABC transporter permease [Gordonia humi]MBB4135408.1 peptide/nickel transport system permease protein [Gordonia humi]